MTDHRLDVRARTRRVGADRSSPPIQRRGVPADPRSTAGNQAVAAILDRRDRGAGRPLDPAVRRQLESFFGRDLGAVRLHDGAEDERSAASIDAAAYTVDEDVVWSRSVLDPTSPRGRFVLAHEVAHIVQRSTGSLPEDGRLTSPSDDVERDADAAATDFTVLTPSDRGRG